MYLTPLYAKQTQKPLLQIVEAKDEPNIVDAEIVAKITTRN